MNRFRILVFDGDDTLWESMSLYHSAKRDFIRLLVQEGFEQRSGLELFEKINIRNWGIHGFSRKRFPLSMVETYIELCADANRQPNSKNEKEIRAIGESVFNRPAVTISSVPAVLRDLSQLYTLILCTKGDQDVQEMRIDHCQCRKYFHRIFIVPDKGEEEFRSILEEYAVNPSDACSIGNSLRSDINPALRLGMFAIWIPAETWPFEHDDETESDRLLKIKRIEEVVDVLRTLELKDSRAATLN